MDETHRIEAIQAKREMESLLSNPGWQSLQRIFKAQTQLRENEILLKATEKPYEQEFQKGEVHGVKLLLQYPETVVENAKAVIDATMESEDKIED